MRFAFSFLLACIVTAATIIFLTSALHIRAKFKEFLAGETLQFALDNPTLVTNKVIAVRRGAILGEVWEAAATVVTLVLVFLLVWGDPQTDFEAAGFVSIAATAIVLPWLVFWWSLGRIYVLSERGVRRLDPLGRETDVEWHMVRNLDYHQMRDVFTIDDGKTRFTVDTTTRNWRYFFEYAKAKIPMEAWTDRARYEMADMERLRKEAGPHMVRQAKAEEPHR